MAKSFARIDGLTATEANKVIIFRKGPGDHTQMLVWDFNSDIVTPGQWLKARVYSRRSDVTPDGKYVAYFARVRQSGSSKHTNTVQPEEFEDTYIAISRPPYYSGVGLWFCQGSYGGAGIWQSNRTFHAHPDPYSFREVIKPPSELKVLRKEWIRDPEDNIFKLKLFARGWQPTGRNSDKNTALPRLELSSLQLIASALGTNPLPEFEKHLILSANSYEKPCLGGRIRYTYRLQSESASVIDCENNESLSLETKNNHPLWIDTDNSGRLVYADKGCLYAWKDFPEGKPILIADLNPNTFENIPPPDWALKP